MLFTTETQRHREQLFVTAETQRRRGKKKTLGERRGGREHRGVHSRRLLGSPGFPTNSEAASTKRPSVFSVSSVRELRGAAAPTSDTGAQPFFPLCLCDSVVKSSSEAF